MPGRGAADYTGFLCVPEHQHQVALAFAKQLLEFDWRTLRLQCLRASERRTKDFLAGFASARFEVERESMMMASGVDNSICPYADLPDDWDRFLAGASANTRQRVRRLLRKIDGTSIRITHADQHSLERDIDILLQMWSERWAGHKRERLGLILDSSREELCDAWANGSLFLPVLWRGDAPIAAAACMMDLDKRELLFQLGARDPAAEDLSPGTLLHAHSIRTAIERGFVRYDFLRGNESYKYSFATGERRIESIVVRRRSATERMPAWRSARRRLRAHAD